VKLLLSDDGEVPEDFAAMLAAAHRRGFQVAVHAVEGPALAAAVAAFEAALTSAPRAHRHRIEHCALCPPPLADRIAALGLTVVVQPAFLHHAGDRYATEVAESERGWLYPLKSLAARGIHLAGSSDAPVGPVTPLLGIGAAVARRSARGHTVVADEALAVEDALALYTRGAAWATCAEGERGMLAPGRPADLVVLGADPTRTAAELLPEIRVALVVIDGELMWPPDARTLPAAEVRG
jgi:hypothetical protein